MIFLYFIFTFVFLPSASAIEIEVQETEAQKTFTSEVAKEYAPAFLKGVESYNKNRKSLPLMTLNQKGVAEVDFKEATLRFSADNLLRGVVYLNGYEVKVKITTLEDIAKLLEEKPRATSVLDFILSPAYAKRDFELLVFKTIVGIKDNFKDFSCWLEKCKLEQFQHNFQKVMDEIKKKAKSCEQNVNGSEIKDFSYQLRDQLDYQSKQWYFEENLKKYFNNLGPSEVTCQKFVETAFKKELDELSKNNVLSRYLEGTSVDAYEGKTPAEKRYNAFISQKCQPYTDLRNCLINQRRGDAAEIFNKMRERGKELPPTKNYQVEPKNGARRQ